MHAKEDFMVQEKSAPRDLVAIVSFVKSLIYISNLHME